MRPTRRARALLATTLACVIPFALQANAEAQTLSDQQTDSISSTARALQKLDGEAAYTDVPVEARPLLTRLKHQLRDLVSRTLDADPSMLTDARVLNARVLAALKREGVTTGRPKDDVHTYGSVISVNVFRPGRYASLIAVTTTVSVQCGEDTSLYLFRREGKRWRLVLADESNDYEKISGARESFDFRVSPADASGDFFVVSADVNPWCTSAWQLMRYRVMRVGQDAYSPRVLRSGEEEIYLGTDLEGFRLTADASTFTLRFDSAQSLDPGRLIRPHVLKFEVSNDGAERIAPVALKPEDFADEWAHMNWDEAARWGEPSKLSELKRWHDTLNPDGKGFMGSEILFVRPCGKPALAWQVGVESYIDDENRARVPPKLYFTVAREGGVFRMRGVSDARPPECGGPARATAGGAR